MRRSSPFRSRAREAPAPVKAGAVVYVRVSTIDQLENFSIETQLTACRDRCTRDGLVVMKEFQEAASAKTIDRPSFRAMLAFCKAHREEVGAVVVYAINRFSRNTLDYYQVSRLLAELGIQLISVMEPFDTSSSGRLQAGIFATFAQYDNDVRSERTIEGMATAIRAGKWVHKAPVGYVNSDSKGGLEIDSVRGELVKAAFEFVESGKTRAQVLAELNTRGFSMPHSGRALSPQTLDKILRNPVYAGLITSSWGIEAKAEFPALITEEQYYRVQARLQSSGEIEPRSRSRHSDAFPLRVFVRCEKCGKGITGSYSTGRSGRKYPHYSCRTKGCKEVRFRQEDLHRHFNEFLFRLCPNPEFGSLFSEALRRVWNDRNAEREATWAQIEKALTKAETRKQKLFDLLIEGRITQNDFDEQLSKVGTAIDELKSRLPSPNIEEEELSNLLEFAEWLLERVAGI